jgi:hypothetical protein
MTQKIIYGIVSDDGTKQIGEGFEALDVGWVKRSATQHISIRLRKASNATCYNAGNPRNAVAPNLQFFCNILALPRQKGVLATVQHTFHL